LLWACSEKSRAPIQRCICRCCSSPVIIGHRKPDSFIA
jgi:hypothetical protein